MKKLSESIFNAGIERNQGVGIKEEDNGKTIVIDGVKYILSKEFWSLGDEFNEECSDDWTCFAFNKPESGNIVVGNSENTGVFGYDKWDIGDDEYDVYVLKDYLDKDIDTLTRQLMNRSKANHYGQEIKDVVSEYSRKLLESHMSELAYFNIYEYWNSEWGGDYIAHAIEISHSDNIESAHLDEDDEFYGKDGECIFVSYPLIDGWDEEFKEKITEILGKKYWKPAKTYEIDNSDSGIPGNIDEICFVRLY